MIISASRRTDIPAFYADWFMRRLRAGFCLTANPFRPKSAARVSLLARDVDAIVFWTKNPEPMMGRLDEIDDTGVPYYFLYTVNDYGPDLEPGVPPLDKRIASFLKLSERLGAARTIWRYDPIILSERISAGRHADSFGRIAAALRGRTERVIVSFVDFYRKTERRLAQVEQRTGDRFRRDPEGWAGARDLPGEMARIAAERGMEIQTCAEAAMKCGIPAGKCVDDGLLRRVFGIEVDARKDRGQRDSCLCVVSRDIGATDTCGHGCVYCYSTTSPEYALERAKRHDPGAAMLCGS